MVARRKAVPKKAFGLNKAEFLRLLRKRAKGNKVFETVDEVQVNMVFANLQVIEKVAETDIDGVTLEEKIKLMNAIKAATASVNDSMKHLGLSATVRQEEDTSDRALEVLLEEKSADNVPPTLEKEFILANEDMETTSSEPETKDAEQRRLRMLDEVRTPINNFGNDPKENDVDVSKEGIKSLG